MSSYLCIKKSGVTIGEWSRNTMMYHAFSVAPYDKEEEFNPEQIFQNAIDYISEEIKEFEATKKKYNKMLEGNLTYEERWDCISTIEELENEIDECKVAIGDICFMRQCWECDRWQKEPPVWTWSVG